MKFLIIKFGLFSALINALFIFGYWSLAVDKPNFTISSIIGFAGIFISSSLIFIAVYVFSKRSGTNGLSFAKGLTTGLLIALFSAIGYALSWILLLRFLYPDFFDDYSTFQMAKWKLEGLPESELIKHKAEIINYKEIYQNPGMGFLAAMTEILPVGILFSFIAALVFKQKPA